MNGAAGDLSAYVPALRLRRSLSLSADGAAVAYASDVSGQFNVWIQPVEGGNARQLTFFTDQSVKELAWAPDSSMIAFTADTRGDEQTQIYTVTAGGGTVVCLSAMADRQYRLAERRHSTLLAGTYCAAATTATPPSTT